MFVQHSCCLSWTLSCFKFVVNDMVAYSTGSGSRHDGLKLDSLAHWRVNSLVPCGRA
jgi:hypothetical protein